MVTVGNIQGKPQVDDWGKHFVGIFRVAAHFTPLILGQRAGFLQNTIRDSHFANIMEERPTPKMDNFVFGHAQGARQADGDLGHPLGMAFGFFIAQIENMRPAFNRGFIGFSQVGVSAL